MKDRLFSILKFVLAVLLLPVVIGVTVSFLENLRRMDDTVSVTFGWGVIVYLCLHILFYEPAQVYDTGKKISEKALIFFSPLIKVAGFCIPIFTIFSFVLYYLASLIWRETNLFPAFAFMVSFTLTMHLVFTANSLKRKQPGDLRENYFFSFFMIYIINMMIVAGAFALLSDEFSFVSFIERCGSVAAAIYAASFRQLFVVKK